MEWPEASSIITAASVDGTMNAIKPPRRAGWVNQPSVPAFTASQRTVCPPGKVTESPACGIFHAPAVTSEATGFASRGARRSDGAVAIASPSRSSIGAAAWAAAGGSSRGAGARINSGGLAGPPGIDISTASSQLADTACPS